MYIKRYLEDVIVRYSRSFKVVYLGGPRQVGKTTMLLRLAKKYKFGYVSLDDLTERELARNDPELFLSSHPAPLFIDEVQYAPELFSAIKLKVDGSNKRGRYWLTGSQQFALLQNIQESLAGRIGVAHLLGLSMAEANKIRKSALPFFGNRKIDSTFTDMSPASIFRAIFRGSFPVMHLRNAPPRDAFYNSYIQSYIDRDLREIFGVEKLSEFHTFLRLCAARTGQILNYSDLARDANISIHAAREWISILESTLQIFLLRPYFQNMSKRLIKAPKLYFWTRVWRLF